MGRNGAGQVFFVSDPPLNAANSAVAVAADGDENDDDVEIEEVICSRDLIFRRR